MRKFTPKFPSFDYHSYLQYCQGCQLRSGVFKQKLVSGPVKRNADSAVYVLAQYCAQRRFFSAEDEACPASIVIFAEKIEAEAHQQHQEEHQSHKCVKEFVCVSERKIGFELSKDVESNGFNVALQEKGEKKAEEAVWTQPLRKRMLKEQFEQKVEHEEQQKRDRQRERCKIFQVSAKVPPVYLLDKGAVFYVVFFEVEGIEELLN